ncbi:MAG: APC family permease [Candidatus Hodarchaeales archaeon]|jgi:APA family basic amino acid/polyamine antiporter
MSESKTYVRDATGLVREIGVVTATIFILSNVIGGGWQKRVFQSTGAAPLHPSNLILGPIDPLVVAFLLTGMMSLATVFCFAVMATAMPRAGGGYVYISRVISPGLGFVAAWAEFLGIAISYGLIAVAVIDFAVLFGQMPAIQAAIDLSVLVNPWIYLILGIIFIFLFAGIAYFGMSMTGKLLHVMFWIPAVITVGIYAALLLGALNPAAMSAGVEAVTGSTPNEWITDAVASGLNDPGVAAPDYFAAVNTAITAAYWAWIGYAAISFAAGEVKEANRSLPISHLAAGFIILGVYISVSTLMSMAASVGDHATGWTFFQAVAFNNHGSTTADPTLTGWGWMPFIAVMAVEGMNLSFGIIVPGLFAIAAVLWLANDLPPFIVTSSRILFAMSFDRTLPESFAKVDERWHSPTVAIFVTACVAILGAFSESKFFTASGMGGNVGIHIPVLSEFFGDGIWLTDVFDAVFFTTACVAAILLPRRLKDVYDRAAWKPKIAGFQAVVVIGWIALILNLYIDLILLGEVGLLARMTDASGAAIPFLPPFIPVIFHGTSIIGTAGGKGLIPVLDAGIPRLLETFNWGLYYSIIGIVVGIVIYLVMKNYYSKRGVDFSTIYASIPPE